MFAVFAWFWWRRSSITNWALLGGALILVVGIPFLLPHMHDRYFYAADILSLAFAVAAPAVLLSCPSCASSPPCSATTPI